MKKFKDDKGYIFLIIAFLMTFAGIFFVGFALTHSEVSFGWSNAITYTFFGIYTIITFALFFIWAMKRWR